MLPFSVLTTLELKHQTLACLLTTSITETEKEEITMEVLHLSALLVLSAGQLLRLLFVEVHLALLGLHLPMLPMSMF